MKLFLAILGAALAWPAGASAAEATLVSRDLPLTGVRLLSVSRETPRFNLVGLQWQGSGSVTFRTRGLSGRWSPWLPAAPEDEDRPDRNSTERSVARWQLGNPYWSGPSDGIEYHVEGDVSRVRAHFVWSPVERRPLRTLAAAGTPEIVPRLSWGANEAITKAPRYTPSLRFAVVHHTAGSNGYSRDEAVAIVKGIQLFHVRGNGWNDIGYNFLVDRFGRIYEGRAGGLEKNVIGAHAEGFNTGSVGVAVIGTYGSTGPSPAARAALMRLLAWRLDVAHVDPLAALTASSGGNARFPAGVPVSLQVVSGHRDTGFTTCPGDTLYGGLGSIARATSAIGLPKLFEPAIEGKMGGPVRFTARLSSALFWTVSIIDADGVTVARGTGTGAAVDWTWDSASAAAGAYSWWVEAADTRPASGRLVGSGPTTPTTPATPTSPALALTGLHAEPASISPNGDALDDAATISYTLAAEATVTAILLDAQGNEVSTLFAELRPAGEHSFAFSGDALLDGMYTIELTATDARGVEVSAEVEVSVNRVVSSIVASRALMSPNGDGRLDTIGFAFTLAEPGDARFRILREGAWIATPFVGPLEAGAQVLEWDGTKRVGRPLDGDYEAELTVTIPGATVGQRVAFRVDSTPPRLRLLGLRPLRFHVSEPATVVLTLDGRRRVVARESLGPFAVGVAWKLRRFRAVAWDEAGNTSLPLRRT